MSETFRLFLYWLGFFFICVGWARWTKPIVPWVVDVILAALVGTFMLGVLCFGEVYLDIF